jgi:hypothetical protein
METYRILVKTCGDIEIFIETWRNTIVFYLKNLKDKDTILRVNLGII